MLHARNNNKMSERLFHVAAAPFEAARRVLTVPDQHPAHRLHGHSFVARLRAELPPGWAAFAGGETDALKAALDHCIATLDYSDLNQHLAIPTDENLARWVRRCLHVPGIKSVGIQSTRDQGANLDADEHASIWRRFRFEAAHQLPNVRRGHPCGRMHGHGFEVVLHAKQAQSDADRGIDLDALDVLWEPIQEELQYACLNDIPGLENPTSEMIAGWLWRRLKPQLPALCWITVYETITAGCHYDGTHYRIWKERRFESALRLMQAPQGDRRRRLHGHSYLLRLHLSAPLDQVLGWTVDYGDVKQCFEPVYKQLDHHLLNELPGLDRSDPASLARWMRETIGARLPRLDRIDLHQTPGCGAVLCWGASGPADAALVEG
jgi:6-pyruvoyltetrahydropterin/6-carboxytetrahydropterin synthase